MLTENQEKMLVDALFNLLVAANVIAENAQVVLPMLVCIAEDYTEFLKSEKGVTCALLNPS